MRIAIERIDFYHDEIANEYGEITGVIPTFVDVDYKLYIGKQELDGEIRFEPEEYNMFSGRYEIIEYIKNEISSGIR